MQQFFVVVIFTFVFHVMHYDENEMNVCDLLHGHEDFAQEAGGGDTFV